MSDSPKEALVTPRAKQNSLDPEPSSRSQGIAAADYVSTGQLRRYTKMYIVIISNSSVSSTRKPLLFEQNVGLCLPSST